MKLSRARIENSPAIATHKPVSRQYEEEYYRYFGWPSYWLGESLPAMPAIPIPGNPSDTVAAVEASRPIGDAHLRSTRSVEGYHVQGTDRLAARQKSGCLLRPSKNERSLKLELGVEGFAG